MSDKKSNSEEESKKKDSAPIFHPRILVVDDEEGIRSLLEQRLSKIGYKVDVAANGLHALQKLRGGLEPHLVICDIKMQGMNGVELLSQVRKDPAMKHLPF